MRNEPMKSIPLSDDRVFEIYQDENPWNPREQDNHGIMVCFHNRYELGDKNSYKKSDFNSWAQLQKKIESDNDVVCILPVFMLDHSGITISTTPFTCPWDSGQVGFIFATKESIRKMGGESYTPDKDQIRIILESEIKIYDQYLCGEVYGFILKKLVCCESCNHTTEETLDSCWGFFGTDWKENGIIDNLSPEDRQEIQKQL